MKPIPKLIIIVAVVGGIGYAVNKYLILTPVEVPAPTATVAAPPPVVEQPGVVIAVQPNPQAAEVLPQPAPPVASPDPSKDRGLSALLQSRKD